MVLLAIIKYYRLLWDEKYRFLQFVNILWTFFRHAKLKRLELFEKLFDKSANLTHSPLCIAST